jgi:hypothetical protein
MAQALEHFPAQDASFRSELEGRLPLLRVSLVNAQLCFSSGLASSYEFTSFLTSLFGGPQLKYFSTERQIGGVPEFNPREGGGHRLSNPHHKRKMQASSIELRAVEGSMSYHMAKRRG